MDRSALTYSPNGKARVLADAAHRSPRPAIAAAKRAGGFVWIGLEDPGGKEMADLAGRIGLHPLATLDATTCKQQPKIQNYDEHPFVVIWLLRAAGPPAWRSVGCSSSCARGCS